eukprot:TRINITY_DN3582_c0_g1_i2.p1 TRINITY_DN3582_c0_g1~~TRINITY_DN3582_c0_g1_i2.p1  ORF type:complete len:701 (+),score=254.95 TRINITY_DN3582_c0_g1_i2:56-2104(+)
MARDGLTAASAYTHAAPVKLPPPPRRVRRKASVNVEGETLHELFPEVPAVEARVEKPLKCVWGGKVGTLHLTRNYLCWRGRRSSVVLHFSEIQSLEKSSGSLVQAIELVSVAPGQCAADLDPTLKQQFPNVSLNSLPEFLDQAPPAAAHQRSTSRDLAEASEPSADRWSERSSGETSASDDVSSTPASTCARCPHGNNSMVMSPCKDCTRRSDSAEPTGTHDTHSHTIKPVDLDRVYSILHALWVAHLRVGDRRPAPAPATPRASTPPAKTGSATSPTRSSSTIASPSSVREDVSEGQVLQGVNYDQAKEIDAAFFSCPTTLRDTKLLSSVEIDDVSLNQVYEGLVSTDSDFAKHYHITRGDENYKLHYPWVHPPPEDGSEEVNVASGVRLATMRTSTPLGKRDLYEAQRYWWVWGNLSVHFSCQVPGVTYGTSFRTELLIDFKVVPPTGASAGGVRMEVYGGVMWVKSCMLKGAVQKQSLKALTDCAAILTREAYIYINHAAGFVGDAAGTSDRAAPGASAGTPTRPAEPEVPEEPRFSLALLCRRAMAASTEGVLLLYAVLAVLVVLATYGSDSVLSSLLPRFYSNPTHAIRTSAATVLDGDALPPAAVQDAEMLLARLGLDHTTAVPILYTLLEREVHRALWVGTLVSSALTVVVGIVVAFVVRKLLTEGREGDNAPAP